ncbi:MAG: hypothetical protein RL367_1850 [Pseudomonadota bacterium]|jgi:hypothetical protein
MKRFICVTAAWLLVLFAPVTAAIAVFAPPQPKSKPDHSFHRFCRETWENRKAILSQVETGVTEKGVTGKAEIIAIIRHFASAETGALAR